MLFFNACSTTSSLDSDQFLLYKNKISINKKVKISNATKEQLVSLPAQKPNKKMFGIIPFRLNLYNLTFDKRETKFRWWLKNKVGEAPIIYNENLSKKTSENIRLFLFNKGFLNSEVKYKAIYKNKKVKVEYLIEANERFYIQKITIPEAENTLLKHLNDANSKSLIKEGDLFDINILDQERKRISDHLRNMGYFNFRKDYVVFELDSNNTNHTISIFLKIKEPAPNQLHEKYTVQNIYVLTDFDIGNIDSLKMDTILYDDIYFIQEEVLFKPKIIANGVFFKKGAYFRLDYYQNTLKKLANYGTFKFVDIQFIPFESKNKKYLDVYVHLTSSKKQTISIDLEANHNFIGLTGTSIGFTYQNKNLFKSADLFEFKVSSGVEFNVGKNFKTPLNNADVVVETNYYLNKFIVPFPLKKISKYNNVKTKFQIQYNYERRIQFYSLHSTSFNFGYEWNESSNKRHIYNPIATNLLLITKREPDFIDRLNEIPSLKRSFDEQIILGSNYTFLFNNKETDTDKSFFVFQGKFALAGNIVHSIVALTKQARNQNTPYEIFNREYSQFVRAEGNIIHNLKIGHHSSLNSRFNAGIIVPFGNSSIAPYFQQFYVGGSNSIRAFSLRALGPGTYADTTNLDNPNFFFDQAGDIKFEANTELRFDIYKWFKGALFVDAGNVWLLRNDPEREGGKIAKDNFFNAIAVGVGFGLRLDFNYFVIRTDFSLPLVDPRYTDDRKYPLKDFQLGFGKNSWFREHSIFHLAIGYPF